VVGLDRVRDVVVRESGLAVVATSRAVGTAQASVVNAGVVDHPTTGRPVVGLLCVGERGSPRTYGFGPA